MPRLNNTEDSPQYSVTTSEGSVHLNADNLEVRELSTDSSWNAMLKKRKYLEDKHVEWTKNISALRDQVPAIEEKLGMKVTLSNNYVKYKYTPTLHDNVLNINFEFKIYVTYCMITKKWRISLGYSHVPPVIDLRDWSFNTRNPIGPRILKVVEHLKCLINVFMKRLCYIESFMKFVHEKHKDMEIRVNEAYTSLKFLLKENVWPINIKKTCSFDSIIISITLDDNFGIAKLDYEYNYKKDGSEKLIKQCKEELNRRINALLNLSLQDAFQVIMEG